MDGPALLAALAGSGSGPVVGVPAAAKRQGGAPGGVDEASSAAEWVHFNGVLHTFPLRGSEVNVVPFCSGDHDRGSANLKLKNLVNFGWQHAYHPGQLVAAPPPVPSSTASSSSSQLLAYAIVTPGKREGVVRVTHRKTHERILLKGMRGKVKDLAFAKVIGDESILGCVDEVGNLFVFSISENKDKSLKQEVVLQVNRDPEEARTSNPEDVHRLIWCPYLPDDDDDDEPSPSKLLVLTHSNVAEMWNVDMVVSEYGAGPLNPSQIKTGRLCINDHTAPIVDATFSPDGTALATASADGQVKFFQVYMHGLESPRCLHEWAPHNGKPLSSLFFLDNHRNHQADEQFWKYAVTGADYNSELKVWSCESWTCLQTVRFKPPKTADGKSSSVVLKAALDLSAKFLILSDINRRNVYVLQMQETEKGDMRVGSVSEFATPSAFLSMVVTSAGLKSVGGGSGSGQKTKRGLGGGRRAGSGDGDSSHGNFSGSDDLSESDDGSCNDGDLTEDSDVEVEESRSPSYLPEEDSGAAVAILSAPTTVIDLVLVQPKSLQECRIVYEDALQTVRVITKMEPREMGVVKVKEEEMDKDDHIKVVGNRGGGVGTNGVVKTEIKAELLSPEASAAPQANAAASSFASTPSAVKSELKAAADKITLMSPKAFASKATQPPVAKIKDEVQIKQEPQEEASTVPDANGKIRRRSGGSSPSREVQDILGDSEEQGGLGADIVVTEEPYDDDDLDDIDEDNDEPCGHQNLLANAAKAALNLTDPMAAGRSSGEAEKTKSLNKSADWPAPLIKKELLDHSPLTGLPKPTDRFQQSAIAASDLESSSAMNLVLKKIGEMTTLIQDQQRDIKALRDEVKALKKTSGGDSQQQLLDKYVKRSGQQLNDALKREAKHGAEADGGRMEQAMAHQMKRVAPMASQELAKMVSSLLENDLRQRTARSDAALRDAVSRLAHPKALPEQLAHSVAQSLQQSLQQELRDSVCNVLVPATERAMQNMLQQVSAKVAQGIKEHETKLQAHMAEIRQESQTRVLDPLAGALRDQLHQATKANEVQLQKLVTGMREVIVREIKKSQAPAAVGSPANMPQSPMGQVVGQPSLEELKQSIRRHLAQGHIEEAFQVALSANSLSMVLATCEMVNPSLIFNQGGQGAPSCLLPQHVLLALVQQLGHDLHEKTDVKHQYIQEAIMSLDSSEQTTRQHMGSVLSGLSSQLRKYLSTAANFGASAIMIKQMKMLQFATNSMLRSTN